MALIKRAEAQHVARNAVALDLGDLRREGEAIVAGASADAERILERARAERERLIADASASGRESGYEEGLARGRAEGAERGRAEALEAASEAFAALAESWSVAIARLEADRERMITEARNDIVRLAAVFAEKVARRAVSLDAGVVERQLEAVLRAMVRPTRLVVSVHPGDEARVAEAMPALLRRLGESSHAELMTDESLEPGSCVATMPSGAVIDASISTQIDRMVEALLPDEGGGAS